MKKNKTAKRLLTTLFLAVAMSLVACGGGSGDTDKTPQTASQAARTVTASMTPEQAIALFGPPAVNRGVEDAGGGVTIQSIRWVMPDGTYLTLVYRNGKLWQLITSDATPDHNRTGFIQF